MSSKIEQKRAELALLEAEQEFVARKKAGTVTEEDKLALRALRQEFRETHRRPSPGAVVDPIGAKAKVN